MNMEDYEFTRETASEILTELREIKEAVRVSYICDRHAKEYNVLSENVCIYCIMDEVVYLRETLARIKRALLKIDAEVEK